jgi:DNA-binding beta-propeller fold protein YncE
MRKIKTTAIFAALLVTSTAFASTLPMQVVSAAPSAGELASVGRWVSGSGLGGAEITAYDAKSFRMFVTNGATNQIDIVDIKNPKKPVLFGRINLAKSGVVSIQSVAVKDGIVAIATMMSTNKAEAGRVFLADVNGKLVPSALTGIAVGSLPDSIHFSPNGQYVITANEGEPTSYCLTNGTLPTTTDPNGSISIIDISKKKLTAKTIDFSAFDIRKDALTYTGARVFGPNATVAQDLEPEFITISNDSNYAWVTLQENNAIATIDLTTKTIIAVNGLGFKNFNDFNIGGIDSSDKDNAINITSKKLYGMYQPDGIAQMTIGETTYLITANEGDAREYACLMGGTDAATLEAEDVRFGKNAALTVDATLKTDAVAGRLKVTPFTPASVTGAPINSKTTVSDAYSYGARSFSVWKATTLEGVFTMDQVYDSGSSIEQRVAALSPTRFNADWNTTTGLINAVDARSASKGPEPEGLGLGTAYGRMWMVVGLERDGGLMLYDMTNPTRPEFKSYINTSDAAGNILQSTKKKAAAGDISPEGILIISPKDSPTGKALVLASYELSGTVGIYEITK